MIKKNIVLIFKTKIRKMLLTGTMIPLLYIGNIFAVLYAFYLTLHFSFKFKINSLGNIIKIKNEICYFVILFFNKNILLKSINLFCLSLS